MSSILFVFMLKKHGVGFLPFSELFVFFCLKLFSVFNCLCTVLLSYKSHGLHGLLRALHSHTYIQNTRTAVLSGIWLLPTLHVAVTDKAPALRRPAVCETGMLAGGIRIMSSRHSAWISVPSTVVFERIEMSLIFFSVNTRKTLHFFSF